MAKREITRADVMPMADYAKMRRDHRRKMIEVKKNRRLEVGPHACFYFESYDTMWTQIHEMLLIEKGGEEQIPDELRAYNTLIPKGQELVATMMFEIEDPAQRARFLARLGGIEKAVFMSVGGETIMAQAEEEVERTTEEGKTSSVHFLHFPFTAAQIDAFRKPGAQVVLGFKDPRYGHMTALPEETRTELAKDFA